VRSTTPYFGYNLFKFTDIRAAVSVQDTTTAAVDKSVDIDKGRNIIESMGITFNNADPLNRTPNGSILSATLYGSFQDLASDYDYTKEEAEAKTTLGPLQGIYLEPDLKVYVPLTTKRRPISEVYTAGGYDIMRGYGYGEFFGDSLEYAKLDFHIPFFRSIKKHQLRADIEILTLDVTAESAQIGMGIDMTSLQNVRSSVSIGVAADIILFDHINLKFNTFAGKALEPRYPVLYFLLTAYTYFSA
jgi:hypothetical protein